MTEPWAMQPARISMRSSAASVGVWQRVMFEYAQGLSPPALEKQSGCIGVPLAGQLAERKAAHQRFPCNSAVWCDHRCAAAGGQMVVSSLKG